VTSGTADEDAPRTPEGSGRAAFPSLLEDSAEDLYENAPCGYLSTLPDGKIARINGTLLGWLGYARDDLVGRRSFSDLLTVGGRIYHETHCAPLLQMQGEVREIALELRTADGDGLPVLVTSAVRKAGDGEPQLIRTTVFDARDRRAYEKELLRARQEADEARRIAEAERERLRELATALQRTLLPPALTAPPDLEVAAHYHVASPDRVGGDFYDLFPLSGGTWGLFMGDVCGKGTAAAALTSLARYTLRAAAVFDRDPVAVLANLNTVLNHEYQGSDPRFCTVVFGLLTPDGDDGGFRLTLAGGGHPPAVLLCGDGSARYLHTPGGQLIGVVARPDIATVSLRLVPGDTLLLYTDGLTEAHTQQTSGRYGDEGLLEFAADLAPATAASTVAALSGLLDTFGSGVDDDTAVLAVGVPARPAAGPRRPPASSPAARAGRS
jgi:sigma-B regulation protein RsbU (phosphoserine phosphatase)